MGREGRAGVGVGIAREGGGVGGIRKERGI